MYEFVEFCTGDYARYAGDFQALKEKIREADCVETTRKGESIYSLHNAELKLPCGTLPMFLGRSMSLEYLNNELAWYLVGDRSLAGAMNASKFWKNCSDDGQTVNSNYGYLLFHKRNARHRTQFEHAYECLVSNPMSKKAVMVLYDSEHAYISKDNPCTMFVHFHVAQNQLNMRVIMRSNDILYGTTYDLPFFHIVHLVMLNMLHKHDAFQGVRLGTYIHQALNLHYYEQRMKTFEEKREKDLLATTAHQLNALIQHYTEKFTELATEQLYMSAAWRESDKSRCLKKHCGAVLVHNGSIIGAGYGDRAAEHGCSKCARDAGEKFYSDGCYSVHAEMRAVFDAISKGWKGDWSEVTAYVTHGPCDACCKLLDFIGVRNIVYNVAYKTDYEKHWPQLSVTQI